MIFLRRAFLEGLVSEQHFKQLNNYALTTSRRMLILLVVAVIVFVAHLSLGYTGAAIVTLEGAPWTRAYIRRIPKIIIIID